MQRIDEWSKQMKCDRVSLADQARILGLGDINYIYRLLKEPENIVVDDNDQLWRKIKIKSRNDDDGEIPTGSPQEPEE